MGLEDLSVSLSFAELGRVVAEAQPLVVGGRLQKVTQPTPTTVVLSFYAQREQRHLLIATQPRHARVHLVARKPPSTGDAPAFTRTLRQALRGRALLSMALAPDDRVVELTFGRREEPASRLVAELTGRTSNLYLVGAEGRLVASLRPTGRSDRNLRPGASYAPPPPPPSPSGAHGADRFTPVAAAEPDDAGSDAAMAYGSEDAGDDAVRRGVALSEVAPYSAAVAEQYTEREREDRVRALRDSLTSHLKAARKKTLRLLGNLSADLAAANDAGHLRLCGELLKIHLRDVPPHCSGFTVANVFDPDGGDVRIPLKPNLSPQQNMERLFKRAKKLDAARRQTETRAAAARARVDELDASALAVQEACTLAELEALAASLGRPTAPGAPRRKQPSRSAGPHRFVSADGLEILVGRTNAENDAVTFRMSRGNDVWFHVEGYAGSHVVARVPKGRTLPSETLLDAATLAVRFSQLREAEGGPVAYCACKHVRKPPGARPGQVLYSQSKTLHLVVERSRIDRLFAGGR